MTQAEQLIRAIRRRAMTYGDLQALKVSTCPQKRLGESGHLYLRPGEQIVRKVGRDGLVRIGVGKVEQFCYFTEQGEKDGKSA